MKIAFFTTDFPYLPPFERESLILTSDMWGGVAAVTYHLSLELEKLGHDVTIFTTSFSGSFELRKSGRITVRRYMPSLKIESTPISLGLLASPLLSDEKFDIVHIQKGSPPGALAGYLFAKKNGKPYVVSYHGDPEARYGGIVKKIIMTLFNKFLVDRILREAAFVNTLSWQFFEQSTFLGPYRDKIVVTPPGVDLGTYTPDSSRRELRKRLDLPSDDSILLFVGSLTSRKGPHILLEAMEQILRKSRNSYLVIVGEGTMRKTLERKALDSGISNNVRFTGFVDEASKAMYYGASDLFVLPSFSEAFPSVLLEASASGLPLVVSSLECLKALVREDFNGVFVRVGDAQDLAEKIVCLIGQPENMKRMSVNARAVAGKHSWSQIARVIEGVYAETVRT